MKRAIARRGGRGGASRAGERPARVPYRIGATARVSRAARGLGNAPACKRRGGAASRQLILIILHFVFPL
jgi:hypothetical protein